MTADIYELSVSLYSALFYSGGEVVEHHNLRTLDYQSFNTESNIGPYTAHVSYYKDATCTDLAYTIDDKINRCSPLLGGAMANIVGENKDSWRVKLQAYDSACEKPLRIRPTIRDFKKNSCIEFQGAYITVNMIDQPHQSVPGGGTAFVFYDNVTDCAISKHTNLASATAVFTLPTGVCNNVFLGLDVRAEVCTAEEVTFTLWGSDNDSCDDHYIASGPVPVDAFACLNIGPIPPVRLLCLGDN
jgi:hypothetical protein